jgi:hypothetical protein
MLERCSERQHFDTDSVIRDSLNQSRVVSLLHWPVQINGGVSPIAPLELGAEFQ